MAEYPSGYLVFTVRKELDRCRLEVRNESKSVLDSAVYLFQANRSSDNSCCAMDFRQDSGVQRYERIRALMPGEIRDLGEVKVDAFPWISTMSLAAQVLISYRDGIRAGHPLAGYYTGSYHARDSLLGIESGTAEGLFDSEGRFFFWLSKSKEPIPQSVHLAPYFLYGSAPSGNADTAYGRSIHYFLPPQPPPTLYLADSGFDSLAGAISACFRSSASEGLADSLGLTLYRVEPE